MQNHPPPEALMGVYPPPCRRRCARPRSRPSPRACSSRDRIRRGAPYGRHGRRRGGAGAHRLAKANRAGQLRLGGSGPVEIAPGRLLGRGGENSPFRRRLRPAGRAGSATRSGGMVPRGGGTLIFGARRRPGRRETALRRFPAARPSAASRATPAQDEPRSGRTLERTRQEIMTTTGRRLPGWDR